MGEIVFGGRAAIEETPACISLINCNSPLRWDDRMLDAQFEYTAANQPVILTPFLLMGAMSPVTIPAALVQQIAEALSGIALSQLIRPGAPVVFGSFLSNIDMQSGSPQFGTPESAIGLLCTGQIARHFGLPFRTGGGLNSSQTPDAQAAYESLMTMLPTFLAGANFVMHTAGWLEGGLVACYEKYVIDVQILESLQHEFTPLEIDEESLAFGAHEEVGHGGHFLGRRAHHGALPRLLLPPVPVELGQLRALDRAGCARHGHPGRGDLRKKLEEYEPPPLDPALREELEAYVRGAARSWATDMAKTYDFVIVGGGSAGSALANRLSADPADSVLVLEAGRPDSWWDVYIHMPAALTFPIGNPRYDWMYETEPEPYMNGRRVTQGRGKLLGGSSSINGMIFQRGNPLDYERWAADPGMETWDYAHCLPYFKRMETCLAGADEWRGGSGPLMLERGPVENPLFGAFFEAVQQAGYPLTTDVNGYRQEGFAALRPQPRSGVAGCPRPAPTCTPSRSGRTSPC